MTGPSRIPRGPVEEPAHAPGEPFGANDKAALRRQLAARRAAISASERQQWDARIAARVLAWWQISEPATLGVYQALKGEVDLSAALLALHARGVQLLLPVVVARHAALAFAEWCPGEAMHIDAMGVAVPQQLRMVARPPALLVPCLGFDAQGYRLGYGGGYYDRTLAAPPRPLTAGIAYACQQASFAALAHDIALDVVLTEAE